MFLDQAEFRAQRHQDICMADWSAFLDRFLTHNELPILRGAGSVSHPEAAEWAGRQYDAFAERRRLEAEAAAEARYLEDLRSAAKTLDDQRQPPPAPKPKSGKSARKPRPRKPKGKPGDTDTPRGEATP